MLHHSETAAGEANIYNLRQYSPSGRAKNRRTRIVVLPKLDQFYDLINKEWKRLQQ